ncbi:hypothetical protein JCM14469_37830 [Desulfatiferula olefinivorans]
MNTPLIDTCDSQFIKRHLGDFLQRFCLCCSIEGQCGEYGILDRSCDRKISSDLVLSLNTFARQIHVTRFYPELNRETGPKYMSATCFYLLIHHFGQLFDLDQSYRIYLETRCEVYHDFYEKLGDFDLTVKKKGLGSGHLDIWGHYIPAALPTLSVCRCTCPWPCARDGWHS